MLAQFSHSFLWLVAKFRGLCCILKTSCNRYLHIDKYCSKNQLFRQLLKKQNCSKAVRASDNASLFTKGDVLPCLPVIKILREEPLKPMRLLILALCLQKLLYSLVSGAVSQGMRACSRSDERRDRLNLRVCSS